MPEGSWLKKKTARNEIGKAKREAKSYEEAGREWSASS
jgi:hypothetical protein